MAKGSREFSIGDLRENDAIRARNPQLFEASSNTTDSAPNVEPTAGEDVAREKRTPRLSTPCRIHVHSLRRGWPDSEGVSCKALLDWLELAEVLQTDGPKNVLFTSQTVEHVKANKPEETIVMLFTEGNEKGDKA